jgi:hypothetical protein
MDVVVNALLHATAGVGRPAGRMREYPGQAA